MPREPVGLENGVGGLDAVKGALDISDLLINCLNMCEVAKYWLHLSDSPYLERSLPSTKVV